MTDVLAQIVLDVRRAAARDLARRSRRRRVARRAAGAGAATLALMSGVAAATGELPDFGDLLGTAGSARVSDLGDGRQRVVLDLAGQALGTAPPSAVITDLGVSRRARPAPPGTAVCDSDSALLQCGGVEAGGASWGGVEAGGASGSGPPTNTSAAAEPTIAAGVRTYRVRPDSAVGDTTRTIYIPAKRIVLVVVGVVPGTGSSGPQGMAP